MIDSNITLHGGIAFCYKCPYKSIKKHDIKKHIKSVHLKIIYKCKSCEFTTGWKHYLKSHLKSNDCDKYKTGMKKRSFEKVSLIFVFFIIIQILYCF